MATITRGTKASGGTSFSDGTTAYGSEVETDFSTAYTAWNNHDAGTSAWTVVNGVAYKLSGTTIKSVVQVVTGTSSSSFTTTSSAYQTSNSTVTITPISTSSKILIIASGIAHNNTVNTTIMSASLFRDSTDIGGSAEMNRISSSTAMAAVRIPGHMTALDSPASTSAITYSVKVKSSDNTNTVGWGLGGYTTITAMEIL